jgi:hypothetical protein
MNDEYIMYDISRSSLLIIDVHRDFTLKGAISEIQNSKK